MYGYIYETTNLINGKKYIGQKKSDVFLDTKYLGSGTILNKAINKYGKENFKIKLIEICSNREELNEREVYWISYYNAVKDKNYYNIGAGGTGWNNSFLYKTKEERSKIISKASKELYIKNGKTNFGDGMLGKHHSEETKRKMSISAIGKKVSEETRQKLSESHKGKVSSRKGVCLSEETKRKISDTLKGNHLSEETKIRISITTKLKHYYKNNTEDIKGSLKAEIDRTAKSDPSMTLDDFISDEFSVDGIDGLAKELQIDKDYVKQYFKDLGW